MADKSTPKDRIERYEVVKPDGDVVTVEHNLDKGTTEIVKDETDDGIFKGAELEAALDDAGLSKAGTADEKRARLAEHQALGD